MPIVTTTDSATDAARMHGMRGTARRARPAPGRGPRLHILIGCLLGAAVALACTADESTAPAISDAVSGPDASSAQDMGRAPRLVVLVSIDTLRPDHLGLYGYARFTSPILDAFSRRGVVFEDASAAAPWTLPSHASLLTGLYPKSHRAVTFETRLPEEIPTLARVLRGAGWKTAAVVNTHWLKPNKYGVTRDFEDFLYVDSPPDRRAPNTFVTDQAIQWIEDSPDAPLFVFVHYYDVHADYTSQPEFERLFVGPYDGPAKGTGWQLVKANIEPEFLELCHERFDPDKCTFGSAERPRVIDQSVQRMEFDEADVAHMVDLYDAGIRQMDTEIGRLFSFIETSGISEETLVVVTSDHGEEFLEHGRLDHFLPTWQEVLHIPLIMVGPGLPAGTRVGTPVSNVDVAPTVLGLVGVSANTPLEGLDLAPLWGGEEPAAFDDRYLHGEASGGLQYERVLPGMFPVFRSVRHGRYKLVYDSKREAHALYDLDTDPHELNDISASKTEIAERLVAVMRERQADYSPDPDPVNRVVLDPEEIDQLRALGYAP